MFDQLMHLKLLEQNTSGKNLFLETQVAKLEANVDKLFVSNIKKMQEHNLEKTFLAQKKEQLDLDKNKCLKLENDLMKLKNSKTSGKDQFIS